MTLGFIDLVSRKKQVLHADGMRKSLYSYKLLSAVA